MWGTRVANLQVMAGVLQKLLLISRDLFLTWRKCEMSFSEEKLCGIPSILGEVGPPVPFPTQAPPSDLLKFPRPELPAVLPQAMPD